MAHESLRERKITERPVLDQGQIAQISKPTRVIRGVTVGYSMPIWNETTNVAEELLYRTRVQYRWDGTTDPRATLVCYLSEAEDVGDKFKFQIEYSSVNGDEIFPDTYYTISNEATVIEGFTAAYSKYTLEFEFDATKIMLGDLLSARLRRIAASASEVTNEIVAVYLVMEYKVNKCYGVWGVSA